MLLRLRHRASAPGGSREPVEALLLLLLLLLMLLLLLLLLPACLPACLPLEAAFLRRRLLPCLPLLLPPLPLLKCAHFSLGLS